MEPTVTLLIAEYDKLKELSKENNYLKDVIKELKQELDILRISQFKINNISNKVYIKWGEDGKSVTYSIKVN